MSITLGTLATDDVMALACYGRVHTATACRWHSSRRWMPRTCCRSRATARFACAGAAWSVRAQVLQPLYDCACVRACVRTEHWGDVTGDGAAAASKYHAGYPQIVEFLVAQGRMKFVRPLYRALYRSDETGKQCTSREWPRDWL